MELQPHNLPIQYQCHGKLILFILSKNVVTFTVRNQVLRPVLGSGIVINMWGVEKLKKAQRHVIFSLCAHQNLHMNNPHLLPTDKTSHRHEQKQSLAIPRKSPNTEKEKTTTGHLLLPNKVSLLGMWIKVFPWKFPNNPDYC